MEYRRTNPHPSLPTSSLTHTHTPTQSRWTPGPSPETVQPHWDPCACTCPVRDTPVRDTPTIPLVSVCVHRDAGLPVRSQGCTYNPAGLPVRSQGCALRQTPNQDAPLNLSPPIPGSMFYTIYITRDSTAQRVCSPGVGFNPLEFLVALWPTCVVLSRYVSSPVA